MNDWLLELGEVVLAGWITGEAAECFLGRLWLLFELMSFYPEGLWLRDIGVVSGWSELVI